MNWIKQVEKYHKEDKHLDAVLMEQMWPDIKAFVHNIIKTGTQNYFTKTPYMAMYETHGKNRSPEIDKLILRNGGQLADSYCVWGVQDILRNLEQEFSVKIDLPKTGGVQKFWERTDKQYKTITPKEISIGCYEKVGTTQGHMVLVLGFHSGRISTFEFNTSDNSDDSMVRNGEGCFHKERIIEGFGDMKLLGFVDISGAMKI